MAKLKERIENNPAVFFLTAVVAGFVSGIGAYEALLRITNQEAVASEHLQALNSQVSNLKLKIVGLEANKDRQR